MFLMPEAKRVQYGDIKRVVTLWKHWGREVDRKTEGEGSALANCEKLTIAGDGQKIDRVVSIEEEHVKKLNNNNNPTLSH